ncbi:cupin domain-containing protein [uncultured Dokdonia sp.]|uniref:cupin domain-containing protein n=1 Tax=uncultured Dokdonia sp. TaxID=575653 RepID=UPI00263678D4|nr:cupin domain-containing protein [uncultured Dokdonia sp.]
MNTKETLIKSLDLQPHPEGGYYKETYRSQGNIAEECLSDAYNGSRSHATGIYFLLTSDNFSAFHKINQDEMWHFYDGASILLHIILKEGVYSQHIIGRNILAGEVPQLVVKGGDWFAAEVIGVDTFSFVGCTVSPGFDFKDFVLPSRKELVALFPEHTDVITRLTHH